MSLLPGVYVHLVSGRLAVVIEEDGYTSRIYGEMIQDECGRFEHTPGFPVDFGTLTDQPEIWEYLGEL